MHVCRCGCVFAHVHMWCIHTCSNYMAVIGGAWSNTPPIDVMYIYM